MPRIDDIGDALITHYAAHARVLPWRRPPGDGGPLPDPYRVWLSEVMLQQTTVAAVTSYFNAFVGRWPDVAALAAAESDTVMAAWAGLGYYSRARNLIACARRIMADHGGAFPHDPADLIRLPGIGPYTAAAINAFAFGGDAIPIDANVERVIARIFAITTPLPSGKRAIAEAARMIWPMNGGGDFAQALMDLGASACSARRPRCDACPVQRWCLASARGLAETLPAKAQKKARPERHGRAWWIERGSGDAREVRLVRRPPNGLLGGMRALPGTAWKEGPPTPAPKTPATNVEMVRHIFTHFTLHLAVERGQISRGADDASAETVAEGEWWPISRLDEAGLPALYRRAAELMLRETV